MFLPKLFAKLAPLRPSLFTLLFVFLILLLSDGLQAQIVNIQPELRKKTKDGFAGKMDYLLEWQTGNTNLFKTEGGLILKYRQRDHLILGLLTGGIAETSGEEYVNKYMGHIRYLYHITQWLAGETFGQYEEDKFKRIDKRMLAGIGPRLTLPIDSKWIEISLGSAYMLEYNRNSTGPYLDSGLEDTYHRWSNYINLDIPVSDDIYFFSTFYIQPRWDQFSDYRLLNDNSINIKINKFFAFKLAAIISYDSAPLESVEALNTSLKTSLSLSYGP